MMNFTDVISVDPGQMTLGSLHPAKSGNPLENSAVPAAHQAAGTDDAWNVVFASATPHSNRYGICILMLRFLFAAVMIVAGSFILTGQINSSFTLFPTDIYAVTMIVFGGMLALGFLSRLAMLGGTAIFGFAVFHTIMAGLFNMSFIMLCLGCLVFLMLGNGRFSIDGFIRQSIRRHQIRRRKKIAANRLTYRAYRYANYN